MINKDKLKRKRAITEKNTTPAQRRRLAELRQRIKERNAMQLQKTGLKAGGNIEVTDNKPVRIETR